MWTDEDIEQLRALAADGFSCSLIAAELGGGKTRNAVIGKLHRLGIQKGKVRMVADRNAQPKVKRDRNRFVPSASPLKPLPPEITSPSLEMRTVTLAELDYSHCRWPIGDPHKEDFRFCGADKEIDRSYCAFHAGLAYVPADKRQQQRRRELKAQRLAARYAGAHL